MTRNATNPASAAAPTGSGDECLLGSEQSPDSTLRQNLQGKFRNPRAVRAAKRELLREAVHEACGFIRLHAETCQLNAEAGDDTGASYSLGRLIAFAKFAAKSGNDLRAIRDEDASNKEAGQ
jgi:hypothetical protein